MKVNHSQFQNGQKIWGRGMRAVQLLPTLLTLSYAFPDDVCIHDFRISLTFPLEVTLLVDWSPSSLRTYSNPR